MQTTSAILPATPFRRWPIRKMLFAFVLLLSGWLAYGLYPPRQSSLRQFDANAVARLETAMWRSYYDKERHP
ncbi:MAG: hypothetical protein HOP19_06995, partial [Acidobacteria bacterium]|nr:hypothetical protein [Acidobacteriota bacterium]